MSDQNWRPLNAEDDGCAVLITYRNEAGEEHVHVADSWGVDLDSSIFHTLCWRQCSGDWPGCKSNCPPVHWAGDRVGRRAKAVRNHAAA